MCWLFHKWTKWSDPYLTKIILNYGKYQEQSVQERKCYNCGILEIKKLKPVNR